MRVSMEVDEDLLGDFKRLYTRKRKALPADERGKLWGQAATDLLNLSLKMAIKKLKEELKEA